MLNVSKTVAKWAKIKEAENAESIEGSGEVSVKESGGKQSKSAKGNAKPSK